MREEQPIVAHVAIQQDPTVREELGVNRDVIGGVRYVMIETRHFKVLLPIDSAKELALRLEEAANPQNMGDVLRDALSATAPGPEDHS